MERMKEDERRSRYLDRAEVQKEKGKPFFPETIFKDLVFATLLLLVLIGLAATRGAPLELEANPTGSAAPPRPEWYFLFLFEALKYVPGQFEWVGAVIIPTIGLIAFFLLPLYDRSPWRHPLNRPLATGLAVTMLAAIVVLTYMAATAPEPAAVSAPSPIKKLTPLEQNGKRVYDDQRCAVCHTINGVGGSIGPDLSTVGRRLDATWLVAHLESPAEIAPGTRMPEFSISNDDLMALTAYLLSLKQAEQTTPAERGAALYAVYCNSCHPGGQAGLGPAIAGAPPQTVAAFVRNGGRGMPAFQTSELTDDQLTEIIAYIQSLR